MRQSGKTMFGVRLMAAALALWAAAPAARAQWRPDKPVEVILMAAQGGGSDKAIRAFTDIINKRGLGPVTLTTVNKPGGLGVEAFAHILAAKDPDHVVLVNTRNFYIVALRHPELGADITLFTPIALMGVDSFLLWVHGDRKDVNSMADFVNAVRKKKREAGAAWVMGGSGEDSEDAMLTAWLNQQYDMDIKYQAFGGGVEVARQLQDKGIDSSLNIRSDIGTAHAEGKMKPLVVFSSERLAAFPDVPTLLETGGSLSHQMPRVIAGPPGMSIEAQLYYVKLFKKVFDSPEWRAYREQYSLTGRFMTGPALTEYWQDEIRKRRMMLAANGVFSLMNRGARALNASGVITPAPVAGRSDAR